jgi:hypothetical protein
MRRCGRTRYQHGGGGCCTRCHGIAPVTDKEKITYDDVVGERIVIGIHGVGSPNIGSVVRSILSGYANAHPASEIDYRSTELVIGSYPDAHAYPGILLREQGKLIKIWEVNWSDLKGLPDGLIGTLLYALKAVIAAIQLSDRGWNTHSNGTTGPLICGRLLRVFFCIFVLVLPINIWLVGYGYVQSNPVIAVASIVLISALACFALLQLTRVDPLVILGVPFLAVGLTIALLLIAFPSWTTDVIPHVIQSAGLIEGALGLLVFLALGEVAIRFSLDRNDPIERAPSVLATRAGMTVLAVTIGAAAYGAFVNAAGFFALDKLRDWHLADVGKVTMFGRLYLDKIGYHVAQMELINWVTTILIGGFLVFALGIRLWAISVSSDECSSPRGLWIRNSIEIFLWLAVAGFLFVFATAIADHYDFFQSSNLQCAPNALCSVYGIQWLLQLAHYAPDPKVPLTPVSIYAKSATRILPFALMVLVPSLRTGLNAAADVLLYILPADFPFSLQRRAKERFLKLFMQVRDTHTKGNISILAHSQGTVIVRDVLGAMDDANCRLVTVGSPLSSLYGRFLGRPVTPVAGCDWVNIFRPSDYIGGPITEDFGKRPNFNIKNEQLNVNYGATHFLYFEDAKVVEFTLGETTDPSL